eukprot:4834993-Pyramimonas_sp.AAC.1
MQCFAGNTRELSKMATRCVLGCFYVSQVVGENLLRHFEISEVAAGADLEHCEIFQVARRHLLGHSQIAQITPASLGSAQTFADGTGTSSA